MRVRTKIAFTLIAIGLSLIDLKASYAGQKNNTTTETSAHKPPIQVTIVVKDTAGASTGLTPTVQLYGEAQDGTVYTGNPRNSGDHWTFVVPGPGMYTAEVSAPGYKTAQRLLAIANENDNPQYDVTLEPDLQASKVKGKSIMAPKARAELEKGKHALGEKRFDEAALHLEKVLRLAPASPDANYYSGLLYYYTGNWKAAIEHLQKSVSMDHNNGPAFLALGEVYYLEKDFAHATNVLEQGLMLEPDSWRAEAVLGSAYFKQADYEKGREHAQKALTIGKDEASGTDFLLGKCLAALGRKTEAIAAFEAFLALQTPSDLTRSAQGMLKQLQAAP
jgi:tetratricopeptide (TPR) repeat protein